MLTVFCFVAVVLLLGVHEVLVASTKGSLTKAGVTRRLALIGAVIFSVVLGNRAQLSAGLQLAMDSWFAQPSAFERSGDTFLSRSLQAQRPDRPFPSGGGPDDVRSWQADLIEALRKRSEFDPNSPDTVGIRVLETQDIAEVRRTLIVFSSWDGASIPAYVHEPKGATNRAGVLVIPGHGGGIRPLSAIGRADYQHGVAMELAKRGYVTLAPELRGFGMLTPDGASVHTTVAQTALAAGTSYKAVVVRDLRLALTALQQWSGVEGSRLGVVGTSLGGELAVLLGVLDSRPRVIISHSYGGVTGPEIVGAMRNDAEETPHGCHTIPGINRILHREDWFRLLAPRALQIARGSDDLGRRADVRAFETAASEAFRQLGALDRFEFSVQPGGHEFFLEPAVRFLGKWL